MAEPQVHGVEANRTAIGFLSKILMYKHIRSRLVPSGSVTEMGLKAQRVLRGKERRLARGMA